MNGKIELSETDRCILLEQLRGEIETASGRKALEFGSGTYSLAEELRGGLEYLACSDKDPGALEDLRPMAEVNDISLIPDAELGEDCYFGRFHMVYTVFGFFGLPHLVDEVMRLRRLIIRGGKLVVIDRAENDFEAVCIKQLKRCGFVNFREESLTLDGSQTFLISAEK